MLGNFGASKSDIEKNNVRWDLNYIWCIYRCFRTEQIRCFFLVVAQVRDDNLPCILLKKQIVRKDREKKSKQMLTVVVGHSLIRSHMFYWDVRRRIGLSKNVV
jgi:hypothetical protein